MTRKHIPLLATIAILLSTLFARVRADEWTEQEVLLARLAVNEASGRVTDTIAITLARASKTPAELRRMHPRALNPHRTDSRRWIAGLDGDMGMPVGWPADTVPWSTGERLWMRTLLTVRETLRGEHRCADGVPLIWAGRMDQEHLARRLAQGMVIVDCGATANTYLRRGPAGGQDAGGGSR